MDTESQNNMSFSLFIDNTQTEQKFLSKRDSANRMDNFLNNKRPQCWIDDSTVTSCHRCNKAFSYTLRKHHCRLCGRIYCYVCSNYQSHIPTSLLSHESKKGTWSSCISSYLNNNDGHKYRVCKKCHDFIERIENVQQLIEIFKIVKLDIKDLKVVARTCKLWNNAANYLLSIFKDVQYKIHINNDYTDYNDIERSMLMINAKYLVGHNRYMVHVLKSCRTENDYMRIVNYLKDKRKISCWSLMCCSNCKPIMTPRDAISLLSYSFKPLGKNDLLRSIALNHLHCSDREFKCYLPLLVYYIRFDDGFLVSYLIDRCMKNISLLNCLYWELQMYPKDEYHVEAYSSMLTRLKQLFSDKDNQDKYIILLKAHSLISVFNTISKNICDDGKKYTDIKDKYLLRKDVVSPLQPDDKIVNILVEKIKIKNSATRPIIIPCQNDKGDIINFLHKKENLRKDQIVTNIIKLADQIIKEEEGLDCHIVTYDVLPTGKNEGLIEIIDECETLYFIQEKINSSILNYILENNGNLKIKDVRCKFIKSCAFYCVISYLLGIGDRHLDNIMVTKDGKLFHIDYGYILGNDPVFNNPGIRITPEIIDAIGGLSSHYYIQFKDLCTQIYNCLRRNIDLFINMLQILPKISDISVNEEQIRKSLVKRFIPGEDNVNARLHMVKQLEGISYTYQIKDWCHYHSKEKTISSAIGRFSNAISSLWSPSENEKPLNDDLIKDRD